jgi:asparagine synthase (glutamine-hydrolysing)
LGRKQSAIGLVVVQGDVIMAGIVGIADAGKQELVAQMLEQIAHRGESGYKIIDRHGTTLGAVWSETEAMPAPQGLEQKAAWDGSCPTLLEPSALVQAREPFALSAAKRGGVFLARDPLGVCPLYYGRTDDRTFCFASEVKALREVTDDVQEFPAGTWYDSQEGFQTFFEMEPGPDPGQDPERIAAELRVRLDLAVSRQIKGKVVGCWLSGSLASRALAALARPRVEELHTFAVGTPGTPDLEYARRVASFLQAQHHEITVILDEVQAPLPAVIWHLESFDVPLVRSSVRRYLAAERAAGHVEMMLFDEGAEELFGAKAQLQARGTGGRADEITERVGSLHKAALQGVDRSASAQGLVAQVPFLDLDLVEYAISIPAKLKLRRNGMTVDKWILRQALAGVLPDDLLHPPATTNWQGAGVGFLLTLCAEEQISDEEYCSERTLPNGWTLQSKEALMYYRIFRERFGHVDDLSWMGREEEVSQV